MTDDQVVVSIIVACRNEIKDICRFLDSLLLQDMVGIPWEAVIADGMSDDGTRVVLEEYSAQHPQLRVLANPRRIVSTGLNAAIRAARGDIIIRMDAHSWYSPSYCRLCLQTLERTDADFVGGPVLARADGVRARAVAAAFHSSFATGGVSKFRDVDYEGWVNTLPYGCWHKATLEEIGLFDETLVREQDNELSLRLLRAGGKIWQSPDIVSWYSPRPTLSSLFHQYFQYGFWQVAVIRKHRLPISWRKLVPLGFVLANALLLGGTAVARVIGAPQWLTLTAILWLIMVATYVVATLMASVVAARRHGWATLPYLPAFFASYHFAYGLGCLAGVRWYFSSSCSTLQTSSVFTRLTR